MPAMRSDLESSAIGSEAVAHLGWVSKIMSITPKYLSLPAHSASWAALSAVWSSGKSR